jgi:Iodothyronine deiodinase
MLTLDYNYRHFQSGQRPLTEFPGPRAGQRMPDFTAYTTEGDVVAFSDLLDRPLVLETCSLTCPMYGRHVEAMNHLAVLFPAALFVVLYVREIHPGRKIGPHRDLSEKVRRARELRVLFGEQRRILVDDLEGRVHCALGGFPNLIYVVQPGGRVNYRSDWVAPRRVERVLRQPDAVHSDEHVDLGPATFLSGLGALSRGGWDAALDFASALPCLIAQQIKANLLFARYGRLHPLAE